MVCDNVPLALLSSVTHKDFTRCHDFKLPQYRRNELLKEAATYLASCTGGQQSFFLSFFLTAMETILGKKQSMKKKKTLLSLNPE